jgi:hypothetical protein
MIKAILTVIPIAPLLIISAITMTIGRTSQNLTQK